MSEIQEVTVPQSDQHAQAKLLMHFRTFFQEGTEHYFDLAMCRMENAMLGSIIENQGKQIQELQEKLEGPKPEELANPEDNQNAGDPK